MSSKFVLLLLFIFSLLIAISLNHIISSTRPIPNASFTSTNSTSTPIIPANRSIAWNDSGIPGGIPSTNTICANVKNPPYNAKGNGIANDTSAIQNAINACPNDTVVYIPAGNYVVSGLTVTHSVVIRGAGIGVTNLLLKNLLYYSGGYSDNLYLYNWTAGYNNGTSTITLNSTANLYVGEEIGIDELNPSFENTTGIDGLVGGCSRNGATDYGGNQRCVPQIDLITSITGDKVKLATPVYFTHSANLMPQLFTWTYQEPLKYGGIENITINEASGGTVTLNHCIYCWINNTEFRYSNASAMLEMAVYNYGDVINSDYFNTSIRNNNSFDYGIQIDWSSAVLMQNNIFNKINWAAIQLYYPNSGMVFAYNYMANPRPIGTAFAPMIADHSGDNYGNLYEGNLGPGLFFDDDQGSTTAATIFRNNFPGYEPNATTSWYDGPISFQAEQWYNNAVGNIFGVLGVATIYQLIPPNSPIDDNFQLYIYNLGSGNGARPNDPMTITSFFRDGNWDSATNGILWSPSVPNQSIPASMYLPGKPSWWGNLAWPAFGPSPTNPGVLLDGEIPAEVRFNEMNNITTTSTTSITTISTTSTSSTSTGSSTSSTSTSSTSTGSSTSSTEVSTTSVYSTSIPSTSTICPSCTTTSSTSTVSTTGSSTINQATTSPSTISLYTTTIPSTLPTIPTTTVAPIVTRQHVQSYLYVVLAGVICASILTVLYKVYRTNKRKPKEKTEDPENYSGPI